jgi:hypothetical protein
LRQTSENVHELQNMINVVNVCSNEYNLHVNLLKTKFVIFRNQGNIKSEEKWYLNGESIEICNEFMYLGILLNYNGSFFKKDKCNVSISKPLWKPHTSHP